MEEYKCPAFSYRGFNVPALGISKIIEDIGNGASASALAVKSIPLAWKIAFYFVGLDQALGEAMDLPKEDLPEHIKKVGTLVYQECQERRGRGIWHKDAVEFLSRNEVPEEKQYLYDKGDIFARYYKNIQGFQDSLKPIRGEETEVYEVWLPQEGWALPLIDKTTGLPLYTGADKETALQCWMESGLSRENAENQASRFYRKSSGIAVVASWSNWKGDPLCIRLDNEPSKRSLNLGTFPAKRLS